jgi:hypothetical protein
MKPTRFLFASICALVGTFSVSALALTDYVVDYHCGDTSWAKRPEVVNGKFEGKIQFTCTFKANQGGTLAQLETALGREIIENAKTVHSGPTTTTFQNLPATHFDATSVEKTGDMSATIRSDIYFMQDGVDRFISATQSKEITASGVSKNLKSLNAGFEIKQVAAGDYSASFYTEVQISKPSLVPTGLFKNMVMDGMKEEAVNQQAIYINKFSETL